MAETDIFTIVNERINRFDLCSLLKALSENDVNLKKLLYVGSQDQVSTNKLCEKISPRHDQIVSAIVELNLGLLSSTSPLPSYYKRAIDKGEINEDKFIPFLQFFNHHLIKNILKYTWVEKFFFKDWDAMKIANIYMMGLDSVSSMHWLFSLYYPELDLKVTKCDKVYQMNSVEFSLGISRLGDKHALGGFVQRKIRGYTIAFHSDTAQTETRIFWPTEIRKRLNEKILPLLAKSHIYLIINLTIDQYKRATYLNQQNFLGFTSLGETTSNFTWSLYEG